ncbi:MAG: ABC transporter permease [Nanoarchaeota archaeon]
MGVRSLARLCDLVWRLSVANFKLRNEGSYLGIVWHLLNPLLMFATLYAIFSRNLGSAIPHYPLYLLIGVVQWNFVTLAVGTSLHDILAGRRLIKSLRFSRASIVVAAVLTALFNHVLELVILIAALPFFGIIPTVALLLPAVLALQFVMVLGLALGLSSLLLYFRDVDHIWLFVSRLWWFATPVFYVVTEDASLASVNMVNPMFHILGITRGLLLSGVVPSLSAVLVLVAFALLCIIGGYGIFKILEDRFAEVV